MINEETGMYRIANVAADIVTVSDPENHPDEEKYTLTYRFKISQTSKSGRYLGEFVIDFLGDGNCGKMTLPTQNHISILISDGITKTTVI
jgi:hypothetical protein